MLDQKAYDDLKAIFKKAGMSGTVAIMEKLRSLEASGRMPRCLELRIMDPEASCVNVIPFGTLDGTRTVWDAFRGFSGIIDQIDAESCATFDRVFAQIAGQPIACRASVPRSRITYPETAGLPN